MIEQITDYASLIKSSDDITKVAHNGGGLAYGLVAVGAGLAMVGAAGAGAGQGIAAGRAADAVGRNPEAEAKIRTMMIVGSAIAESAAIYALIVSILLIFVY